MYEEASELIILTMNIVVRSNPALAIALKPPRRPVPYHARGEKGRRWR